MTVSARTLRLLTFLGLFLTTGCGTVGVERYSATEPKLVLEEYFSGPIKAHGYFRARNGEVQRQFVVDMLGRWDPETRTLTLEEDFVYDDGETERRVWTLRKTGENTYEGTTAGVVGVAKGQTSGNAFNWVYDFAVPRPGGSTITLRFDDWMFLQPDDVLINQATLSKFGFRVGEVIISFQKPAATGSGQMPVFIGQQAAE